MEPMFFRGEYGFLSNFYHSEIEYEGVKYPTVEHAFQCTKTFNESERAKLLELQSPLYVKRAGKKVTLRSDWEDIKLNVMLNLLRLKFQDSDLRKNLLATGQLQLEENNDWGDKYWGKALDRKTGLYTGQNHLGLLLMQVRSEIRLSQKN